MEDNLTSALPLSYTTNESWVDPVSLVAVSCMHKPTLTTSYGAPNQKHWTDGQVGNSVAEILAKKM